MSTEGVPGDDWSPLLDVAWLLGGAILVLVAWSVSGLRLTIPLAGLWLVAEAVTPHGAAQDRRPADRLVGLWRRAIDMAGYGGLFASSVLLVTGGMDALEDDPGKGAGLVVAGVALCVLVGALFASLVRGRRKPI